MAKKEVRTDLWVASQLGDCGIKFDAQGSNIKELNEVLKSASKRGTGNAGYPEYVCVIGDFVLVIEDKASILDSVTVLGGGDTLLSQQCQYLQQAAKQAGLNQVRRLF